MPFWHRRDGAAQRIFELVRFLRQCGGELQVFFLGQLDDADQAAIQLQGLDVHLASSDQPPQAWLPKMRWYVEATWNQIRQSTKRTGKPVDVPASLRLSDFRWPWAIQRFRECCRRFRPHVILVEYIKLAYLLEALSPAERAAITCLVDTHDVLHLRCQQFEQRGFAHWLQITKAEEAACLARFDVAIAIQDDEAKHFAKIAPQTKTVVARHSVDRLVVEQQQGPGPTGLVVGEPRIGYLGSKNFSNAAALLQFLNEVWPTVVAELPGARLRIAGSLCNWLANECPASSLVNVELMGFVERLQNFYSNVDFVINPVEFGTGLKIKNCEALAFGKPLITTQAGWSGLDAPSNAAVLVSPSLDQFATHILAVARDASLFHSRCRQAVQLARTEFSDEKAYSELKPIVFGI